mgnify:CR=1 FL=1
MAYTDNNNSICISKPFECNICNMRTCSIINVYGRNKDTPNISFDFIAITIPLQINTPKSNITNVHPTNPNSSAIIANMKSLCASGMYKYFCVYI